MNKASILHAEHSKLLESYNEALLACKDENTLVLLSIEITKKEIEILEKA